MTIVRSVGLLEIDAERREHIDHLVEEYRSKIEDVRCQAEHTIERAKRAARSAKATMKRATRHTRKKA